MIEAGTDDLRGNDRGPLMERLKLAREFLGTQDPLDFFRSWKTPQERYRPQYAEDESSQPSLSGEPSPYHEYRDR